MNNNWKKRIKKNKRIQQTILVNALTPASSKQIFILTGPVQTGKTTSLINWSENRNDVFGIITPVISGKRFFLNAHTHERFQMEASPSEKETLSVGKFIFSKVSFNKAEQVLKDTIDKKGWIVIDEVGPLELKNEGFNNVLKEILQNQPAEQKLLLVVRERLVEKVKDFFKLTNAVVIESVSNLTSASVN